MKRYCLCTLLFVLGTLAWGQWLAADDRDLLRERSADPNILIILDSSGSMVGTAESVTPGLGPPYAMLPGSGDDPRSRMGVAKAVISNFLADVEDANFALAQYSQELSYDDAAYLVQPVYQKHWIFEPLGRADETGALVDREVSDRFRIVEPKYAYRFGHNYDFAGTSLINPADITTQTMLGYQLYFDSDAVEVEDRYGPLDTSEDPAVNYATGAGQRYDFLPIYFGEAAEFGIFPVGTWIYQFDRCNPDDDSDDDSSCSATWTTTGAGTFTQWARRARLEYESGDHPPAYEPDSNGDLTVLVGVEEVADYGDEDYDLDETTADADLDGDEDNDWVLYVDMVEQRRSRVCVIPEDIPTWTPTPTPTPTPTDTPTPTPTPTLPPIECSDLQVTNLRLRSGFANVYGVLLADIENTSSWDAWVTETDFTWTNFPDGSRVDFFVIHDNSTDDVFSVGGYYYGGNDYSPPTNYSSSMNDNTLLAAGDTRYWSVDMDDFALPYGENEVCLTFTAPGAGAGGVDVVLDPATCPGLCASRTGLVTPTPTPTPTPLPPDCSQLYIDDFTQPNDDLRAYVNNDGSYPVTLTDTRLDWADPTNAGWYVDWFRQEIEGGYSTYANYDASDGKPGPTIHNGSNLVLPAGDDWRWDMDFDGGSGAVYGTFTLTLTLEFPSGLTCTIIDTITENTPLPTNTPGPTNTPTQTNTPGPTSTATNTPEPASTPTITNTPGPTNSPTQTNTPGPTSTATNTPAPTNTPTTPPTSTPTATVTPTPTETFTPSFGG